MPGGVAGERLAFVPAAPYADFDKKSACADLEAIVSWNRLELYVHLVWTTWDRTPVIDEATEQWLWPAIAAKARARFPSLATRLRGVHGSQGSTAGC